MVESSIYRNALNAIQTGVEDFNDGSPERLASAVRNLVAGILLLCKEKLRRLSPYDDILIWKQLRPALNEDGALVLEKAGKNTVDVGDIEERFKSCHVSCDIALLKRIAAVRNAVEHHFVDDPKQIRGAFVDGLRFLARFMPDHLGADPREELGEEAWQSLIDEKEVEDALRLECLATCAHLSWSTVLKDAIQSTGCPECGSPLIKQTNGANTDVFAATWACTACGYSLDHQQWAGKVIPEYYAAESHIAAKDGADGPVDTCPECGEEAFVGEENGCLACGLESETIGACAVCATPLGLDEYGESLCSYHRYVMERERDR